MTVWQYQTICISLSVFNVWGFRRELFERQWERLLADHLQRFTGRWMSWVTLRYFFPFHLMSAQSKRLVKSNLLRKFVKYFQPKTWKTCLYNSVNKHTPLVHVNSTKWKAALSIFLLALTLPVDKNILTLTLPIHKHIFTDNLTVCKHILTLI